jgi:hypothetical protein
MPGIRPQGRQKAHNVTLLVKSNKALCRGRKGGHLYCSKFAPMKYLAFCYVIASTLFFSRVCLSEDLLNGCKISEWNDSGNGQSYYQIASKDFAGNLHTVFWLKQAEFGVFPNEGHYDKSTHIIHSSPAVEVCSKKKLNLPTEWELQALLNCFGANYDKPFLVNDQRQGLFTKFPDMRDHTYWLSSVDGLIFHKPMYYSNMNASGDDISYIGSDGILIHEKYSVRCVGR